MPCCAPLLSLSHWLLLLCPSCSLFLKHLLSSSPQSSGSECPRRVGLGPFADFLLSTPLGSRSAHMVWFCVGAGHMYKGSTPSLWRSRNSVYLFIPEENYSPFILPQPAAGLLLAQQLEYELCLPRRARGAECWWQLSRAWRAFPEGRWVPPQQQRSWQIHAAAPTNLLLPLFCTQGEICCRGALAVARKERQALFSVSVTAQIFKALA